MHTLDTSGQLLLLGAAMWLKSRGGAKAVFYEKEQQSFLHNSHLDSDGGFATSRAEGRLLQLAPCFTPSTVNCNLPKHIQPMSVTYIM